MVLISSREAQSRDDTLRSLVRDEGQWEGQISIKSRWTVVETLCAWINGLFSGFPSNAAHRLCVRMPTLILQATDVIK